MKYLVITSYTTDEFVSEFETKEEALAHADRIWGSTSDADKKKGRFYVLESVNPDEDAENHYDGNIIKEYSTEFWYAYLIDEDDTDWGTGTFDKDEAIRTLEESDEYYAIAVIEMGHDPIAIEVIKKSDL